MKLFKSLLVAPATLGLLAPVAATANEVTINDFNAAEEIAVTNSRIDGLEARFNNLEAGSFSETTTASFGVDMVVGAEDGATSEAAAFGYQMGIGLSTSFTGEDALSATIDIGDGTSGLLAFDDTSDVLTLDGLTYTFPVGGATVMVGDSTDISAVYTGACAYSAFTDYMGNCGTGSTVGIGGVSDGVTAAMSYAFDSGFSLAGGVSSTTASLLTGDTANSDLFGIEAAYTGDSFGVSVAYSDSEGTTGWGINGMYAFDAVTLSAGVESVDDGATAEGFFVGLSFPEVGAGSLDIGMGTTGNFKDGATEYYTYEASYAYPLNDSVTLTPGIYIKEGAGLNDADITGVALKTSFSF
jgi:hypothetical protein